MKTLKNKKIRVNAWTNDIHKGDRCNICFHFIDVKSAVEWFIKEKKELDRKLLLKKITQLEYQRFIFDKIKEAFKDVVK